MRDLRVDNVKGFLIILVIMGHLIEGFTRHNQNGFWQIYNLIYSFHMPLFVMLSGYLFKDKGVTSRVITLFIIYAVAQLVMMVPVCIKHGFTWHSILNPGYSLWFLLSLGFWNCIYSNVKHIRYIFLISLVVSLLVGFIQGDAQVLSWERTLSFFPFYIFGASILAKREVIKKYNALSWPVKLLTISLPFIIYMVYMNVFTPDHRAAHLVVPYMLDVDDGLKDLLTRAIYLGFSFTLSVGLFSLFSEHKTFLTKVGTYSLPVYLFQAIAAFYMGTLIKWRAEAFSIPLLVVFLFISVLIPLVVANKFFDDVIKIIPNFLMRKK